MQVAEKERKHLAARFKKISGIAGGIVGLLSFLVVLGWYADIEIFKHPFGTSVAFGVALVYFVLGCIIAVDAFVPESKPLRIAKLIVVSVLSSMAAAKCVEGVIGADWEVLSLNLSFNSERLVPLLYPGVMTPDTALVQALTGVTYLLMDVWKKARVQVWQWIAVTVIALCLVPVFGFILGDTNLCSLWGCVRMPVAFAITSIGLGFAMLAARPERGFTSALIEPDLLGTAMRQSLFSAMILLPLFAEAKAVFVHFGIFDEGLAKSGLGIAFMFVFLGTVMYQFVFAYKSEQNIRRNTEQRLQDLSHQFSQSQAENTFGFSGKAWRVAKCSKCEKEFDSHTKICPYDEIPLSIHDALIGQMLEGRYLVLEFLGRGGMSTVYKVEHKILSKVLAIKFLQQQFVSKGDSVLRFQREGKAMARLQHPNLCSVTECSIIEGVPYLVMEFLQGMSLDEILREEKRLSAKRTVEIMIQVADGLQHAHDENIVHRDIKPSNIMMTPLDDGSEHAKVVDFGLARILDSDDQKLSQTGEAFGSPLYMSPEQCLGSAIDARTDIYGLGCVIYECLSGNVPFRGKSFMETFNLHISGELKPFAKGLDVPPALAQLVERMLAKEAIDRPASMTEVKEALNAVMQKVS
ncbi:MAG TPA: serine/threonine protein kinase [Candidatus Melainabacteria bacterium]|nr:serine/threonine protein kinase [Candidatus Melainabacteria bacterium]